MMYLALVLLAVLPSVFVAWVLGTHIISGESMMFRAKRALLWAWPLTVVAIGLLAASAVFSRKTLSWESVDEFLILFAEFFVVLPFFFPGLFFALLIVFSRTHHGDRTGSPYLLAPLGYGLLWFATFGLAFSSPFEIGNYRIWKYQIPPLEHQFGFKLGKGGRGVVFTWVNPEGSLGRAGVRAGDSVLAHHGVVGFRPLFALAENGGPVSVSCTPLSELKNGADVARAKPLTWIVEQKLHERLASRDTGDILREYVPLLRSSDRAYEAMVALEFLVLMRGADTAAAAVPDLIQRLMDLDVGPRQISAPLRISVARILGEMGPVAREAVPALRSALADPRSGADPDALSIPEYAGDPELFRSAAIEALRKIEPNSLHGDTVEPN